MRAKVQPQIDGMRSDNTKQQKVYYQDQVVAIKLTTQNPKEAVHESKDPTFIKLFQTNQLNIDRLYDWN